jgi:phage terminase large subunit GpA-like protein
VVSWTSASHYPKQDRELDHPSDLLNINDIHWKEQMLLRFESGVCEDGFDITASDWILPRNTPNEFVRHMLAEIAVDGKNSRGFPTREWRRLGPNHCFDLAKYALAARYVLKPNLQALVETQPVPAPVQESPRVTGNKPAGW